MVSGTARSRALTTRVETGSNKCLVSHAHATEKRVGTIVHCLSRPAIALQCPGRWNYPFGYGAWT
jgi:hypothetical protein